jgi:adenosylmethionine-8-amino-7-oxononanoate aminotransferase
MVGVELVEDRSTREPVPRTARLTEAIVRGARTRGVLLYSGTGNADGVNGDTLLLGPPFVVTDEELGRIVAVVGDAVEEAVEGLGPGSTATPADARDAVVGSPAAG